MEDINQGPFTLEEIKRAIIGLKCNKSPGIDNITAELLKSDPDTAAKQLLPILEQVRNTKILPDDWKRSILVKIPKKGDLTRCDNYRGISLLSIPGKVLSRILVDRISKGIDKILRKEQAGFRHGRGTSEHIFSLRNIIEQVHEWQATLYVTFVDFRKAFDSLNREMIWRILLHYGIPKALVDIIKEIYRGNMNCVLDNGDTSDWFQVKTGVRQGCVMSGFIFIIVIDWVMRKTTDGRRTGIRWDLTKLLEDLDYADDIALLSSTHTQTQDKNNRLFEYAKNVGLLINTQKTQIMKINPHNQNPVNIDNKAIEETNDYIYLGSTIDKYGGAERDIKRSLGLARCAFASLKQRLEIQSL